MDRRIKYTRRVLNESLLHFLEQKEITRITVTEICSAADVNRSTYYAHFSDPGDQLARLKAELLGEMADYIVRIDTRMLSPAESAYRVLKTLLEYMDTKKDIFRILLGKSGDHHLQEQLLAILGEKAFRPQLTGSWSEEETNALLVYASNGCFGLFYHWLMSDEEAAKTARMMAEFTGSLLKGRS